MTFAVKACPQLPKKELEVMSLTARKGKVGGIATC